MVDSSYKSKQALFHNFSQKHAKGIWEMYNICSLYSSSKRKGLSAKVVLENKVTKIVDCVLFFKPKPGANLFTVRWKFVYMSSIVLETGMRRLYNCVCVPFDRKYTNKLCVGFFP